MYKSIRERSRRGRNEKYNDKRNDYKRESSYSKEAETEEEKESGSDMPYKRIRKQQRGETCSDVGSPTSLRETTEVLEREKEHKRKMDMSNARKKKRKFESSKREQRKRTKMRKKGSREKERKKRSKGSSFSKIHEKREVSTDSEQSVKSSSCTYSSSSGGSHRRTVNSSSSSGSSSSSSGSSSSSSSSSSSRSSSSRSSSSSSSSCSKSEESSELSSEGSADTESTDRGSNESNESIELRKQKKRNAQGETKQLLQKKEQNKTENEKMSKTPFDEHIYDSKEMIRLSISILQNYNYLNNFKILYKKLDNNKKISLEKVKDKRLKKKLRHLFRAWRLEKNDEFYRKPKNFTESISEIFYNLMYYFLSKIDFQLLKENINKRKNLLKQSQNKNEKKRDKEKEPSLEIDKDELNEFSSYENKEEIMKLIKSINKNNVSSKCASNEEIFNLIKNVKNHNISLREMHEEGIFKKSRQAYKEFVEKCQTVDLWGKTEQEQKYLLNLQKNPNERKMFDREKDLCSNKFIKSEDYEKLIKNTKQHINEKFQNKGYVA